MVVVVVAAAVATVFAFATHVDAAAFLIDVAAVPALFKSSFRSVLQLEGVNMPQSTRFSLAPE